MDTHYDIAIIGSGPAGATFARQIDKKFKVILIDPKTKNITVYDKPCGGLLSSDAQKALSQFEITLPKEILVSPQIFAVKTIDVNTRAIRFYQRTYINLDRHKFDLWLSSMISNHVLQYNGKCTSISKNDNKLFTLTLKNNNGDIDSITAKYIVGADGANSIVRKTFFPKKKIRSYVAIQQWFEEKHNNPFYSCVFDKKTSNCCSWSISKDNYFIYGGAFSPKDCRKNFEKQKEKLESFGFQFSKPLKTEACIVLRPKHFFDFCCGADGVLLIGEAAGFISPSSLEGISYAIESGNKLAEVFNTKQCHHNYHYYKTTFLLRLKITLKLLKCPFMYHPFLRNLVMKSGITSIQIKK